MSQLSSLSVYFYYCDIDIVTTADN